MGTKTSAHILVSPLDWGLGHTTRCVPIISHLLNSGCRVTFAGNNWQRAYIAHTFRAIPMLHLNGYDVRYSKTGKAFMFALLRQLPGIVNSIRHEHQWLKEMHALHHFDGVISDNRYGLYHQQVPSVIMTHQLMVQSGMGNKVDNLLMRIHYKRLALFSNCWVVDVANEPNLSGKLGHPGKLPQDTRYIGLLSQLQPVATDGEHLLILLSGPEPQRTILSNLLWQQAIAIQRKIVFVEGNSDVPSRQNIPSHISYYRRLAKEQLQPLFQNANLVLCRSGYSSLMDLVAMNKKAILIPTPGQTEQEYLGRYLHNEGIYYSTPQHNFNLLSALKHSEQFPFRQLNMGHSLQLYKSVVEEWLADIG